MSALRVLITGFGPFPGVDRNYSADLAVAVCSALNTQPAARTHTAISAHVSELAVAWQSVSDQLADLYDHHHPNLAIHFGVCSSATGLIVEQWAQNHCAPELDAWGNPPPSNILQSNASNVLKTRLSVSQIIANCAHSDIDIVPSQDAGRYLCNAAYYTSLSLAARQTPPSDALFVHVPDRLSKDAEDWSMFVKAAVDVVKSAVDQHQRTRPVNLNN